MNKPVNFTEAWSNMEQEVATHNASFLNPPIPTQQEGTLSLSELRTYPVLFQPRDLTENDFASDQHIKDMARSLKEGNPNLPPLTVWWSGKSWYVIDGHHRLEAYRNVFASNLTYQIPIYGFQGSLTDAFKRSGELNSKDKLPMSKKDKIERAWKIVCLPEKELSKKEINKLTGVSTSLIAKMRKYRSERIDEGDTIEELQNILWADTYERGARQEYDEDWKEAQAQKLSKDLRKVFGKTLSKNPDIVALAIENYSSDLVKKLIQEWSDYALEHVEERLAEEEGESDF